MSAYARPETLGTTTDGTAPSEAESSSLRERELVQAVRVLGMPTRRVPRGELLSDLAAPVVVAVSLMLPAFVAR
jgi:ABC-type dipeptide/oligopeptide/nickel transport system permease subunit